MNPALRRVPVDGGDEETLVERFRFIHDLRVSRTGVYFLPVGQDCLGQKQPWELLRYRFPDGRFEVVARFRATMAMGAAVPPDDSYVIVNARTQVNANTMIIEGLRRRLF